MFLSLYKHLKIKTMLTIDEIRDLQEKYNVSKIQNLINSGEIWKFEGSVGRFTMMTLVNGICFLPEEKTHDYYGNLIPSRNDLKPGTKGTLENSQKFWEEIKNNNLKLIYDLENLFQ